MCLFLLNKYDIFYDFLCSVAVKVQILAKLTQDEVGKSGQPGF